MIQYEKIKLKDWLLVGLVVLVMFLLMRGCNQKPKTEYKTNTVERVMWETYHDTLIDTIYKPRTELIYVHSTPDLMDLSDTNELSTFSSTYTYNHKDSLLEASIFVSSESRPKNVEIEYDLLNFTLKDSVYQKDSVYTEAQKSFMSVGATMIGSRNNFGFAPQLQYNHKKGATYSLGYDILNGNLHVGFTKRLRFK